MRITTSFFLVNCFFLFVYVNPVLSQHVSKDYVIRFGEANVVPAQSLSSYTIIGLEKNALVVSTRGGNQQEPSQPFVSMLDGKFLMTEAKPWMLPSPLGSGNAMSIQAFLSTNGQTTLLYTSNWITAASRLLPDGSFDPHSILLDSAIYHNSLTLGYPSFGLRLSPDSNVIIAYEVGRDSAKSNWRLRYKVFNRSLKLQFSHDDELTFDDHTVSLQSVAISNVGNAIFYFIVSEHTVANNHNLFTYSTDGKRRRVPISFGPNEIPAYATVTNNGHRFYWLAEFSTDAAKPPTDFKFNILDNDLVDFNVSIKQRLTPDAIELKSSNGVYGFRVAQVLSIGKSSHTFLLDAINKIGGVMQTKGKFVICLDSNGTLKYANSLPFADQPYSIARGDSQVVFVGNMKLQDAIDFSNPEFRFENKNETVGVITTLNTAKGSSTTEWVTTGFIESDAHPSFVTSDISHIGNGSYMACCTSKRFRNKLQFALLTFR